MIDTAPAIAPPDWAVLYAPAPLAITAGELWCTICGESIPPRHTQCGHCGKRHTGVDPVTILRAGEYVVTGYLVADAPAATSVAKHLEADATESASAPDPLVDVREPGLVELAVDVSA